MKALEGLGAERENRPVITISDGIRTGGYPWMDALSRLWTWCNQVDLSESHGQENEIIEIAMMKWVALKEGAPNCTQNCPAFSPVMTSNFLKLFKASQFIKHTPQTIYSPTHPPTSSTTTPTHHHSSNPPPIPTSIPSNMTSQQDGGTSPSSTSR